MIEAEQRDEKMRSLIGDRIKLWQYQERDAIHIYMWQRDETTTKWMGRRYRIPKSLEEITANVLELIKQPPKDAILYAIADKVTDFYLGGIDITSIDSINKNGILSVVIAEETNRNLGFATEAITLLLKHVFGNLQMHKIELRVDSDNEAAVECYSKLGFEFEGRLRDHIFADGKYREMILMGITETGWNRNDR